jgi:hypothetical protein
MKGISKLNMPQGLSFNTPEWAALEKWAEEELQDTYKRLASMHLEDKEVRQLQGRASVIQQMLDFRNLSAAFRPQS